jgi:hypothetical protein
MHRPVWLLFAAVLLCLLPAEACAASGWTPTGSMSTVHRSHAAVTLLDGRVLVVSGFNNITGEVAQSELYDPATGTWSPAAPNAVPRHYATATRLNDGRVLLAGGFTSGGVTAGSELYDPATNTWAPAAAMSTPRNGHVAVRLANGRVFVAGGANGARDASTTGEVYDPVANTWTPATGAMSHGRDNGEAGLLPDGRVLVAGGYNSNPALTFHTSADLYDPVTNSWAPTGSLTTARGQGAESVLDDGRVLVAGGVNRFGFVTSVEVFDPATGTWSTAPGTVPSGNIGYAVTLEGGRALMTTDGSATTPLIDPLTGVMPGPFPMGATRTMPSLTRLDDGRVLIAGGSNLATAALLTPPTTRTATVPAFGDVAVGDRAERDVTIANTGDERLRIASVGVSGPDAADFTVTSTTCAGAGVLPGATCTVRVRFAPTVVGTRAAALVLDDNAEGSDPVAVTATGTPPPPAPAPAPPGAPAPPALPVAVVPPAQPPAKPVACGSRRRIVVSLGLARRDRVRSGTVTLNGKRLTRLGRTSRSAVVDLRKRPFGAYVVRVRLKTQAGRTVAFTRTFRTCRPRGRS